MSRAECNNQQDMAITAMAIAEAILINILLIATAAILVMAIVIISSSSSSIVKNIVNLVTKCSLGN